MTQTVRDQASNGWELRQEDCRFWQSPFLYQTSLQQPLGTASLLHVGNCVRSIGCTVLSMSNIGKLHSHELRPTGHSHPLLCILISFACRGETRLVRKEYKCLSFCPQDPPLVLPLRSQIFSFLFLVGFWVWFFFGGGGGVVSPPAFSVTSLIFIAAGNVTCLHLAVWKLCNWQPVTTFLVGIYFLMNILCLHRWDWTTYLYQ